jgi:hypothetical protein
MKYIEHTSSIIRRTKRNRRTLSDSEITEKETDKRVMDAKDGKRKMKREIITIICGEN